MDWSRTGYRHAVNLVSKSIHVASEIQAFFLVSLYLGFGIALRRAANIPSSLVRLVGGWIGRHMCLSRYLACSLIAAL